MQGFKAELASGSDSVLLICCHKSRLSTISVPTTPSGQGVTPPHILQNPPTAAMSLTRTMPVAKDHLHLGQRPLGHARLDVQKTAHVGNI